MTMQAIRVHQHGGPEQLVLDTLPLPQPGAGEVLVAVGYAGVNYYDTQLRSGLYPRERPSGVGAEGAGTVAAIGPDVTAVKPGDRVAWYHGVPPGSYATHAIVPLQRLVAVPAALSLEAAAATLFQGLTAHHLACSTYPLGPGDVCVVHSAAGGVGGLLVQIAKLRGARVFGVVSTEEKAAVARAAGADHTLVYARDDVAAEVRRKTGGVGANVVYDAVGQATFEQSLDALRPRGVLAIYGEASGLVPPFDVRRLSGKGSLFVTRTSLNHYVANREELLERAGELFGWVAQGKLRPRIHATYALADAAQAHRDLESRATAGKLLLRAS
jgi:NADPH2:quinone reductase